MNKKTMLKLKKESRENMKEDLFIVIPFLGAVTCQIIKFIIESIRKKKIDIVRLLNGNGGIPSTHTTLVFSLAFTILLDKGITDPLFAIALVLAVVVSYDAMGVRLQTEKQAEMINFNKTKKGKYKHLTEELGHEPFEVATGILFAFLFSFVMFSIFS